MVSLVGGIGAAGKQIGFSRVAVTDGYKSTAHTKAASDPVLQISGNATTLSSLFDAANNFIQKSSVKPLSSSTANNELSYVLDVGKYNSYIFDKAASSIVSEADKIGVKISKDDIIAQLKEANSTIASYKTDLESQQHKLSDDYMSKYFSQSDIDNITDFYIKSREAGLPDISTISYASDIGMAKRNQALGIKYYSGEKYLVSDEANPPNGVAESVAEAAKKLYGHFGLSNSAVNMLAAGYIGPEDTTGRSQAFQFLLQMLEEIPGHKGVSNLLN